MPVEKIKQFVSTNTTKKGFWLSMGAGGLFVCLSIVFEWNDAKMADFHEFCSFAWKAFGVFFIPKAGIDMTDRILDKKAA